MPALPLLRDRLAKSGTSAGRTLRSLLISALDDATAPAQEQLSTPVARAAQFVAFGASVWFALAMTWGLFARVGGGHDVQIATRAIIAENMRQFHTLVPVKDYPVGPLVNGEIYVHHPWGMFWVITAFAEVFGRGTWVPRLVAVLMSIAIPPLLYGIGRLLWGPVAGAICALAYSVCPIALAFGNLPGFELPVIFCCLVATWGYLRFSEQWRRRWMAVSVVGVFAAAQSDWQGCVFIGAVLGTFAVGRLLLSRWFGKVPFRPFAEWWGLSFVVSVATVLAYFAYFRHLGMLDDLFRAEKLRERGHEAPLAEVLQARSYWIDLTFTPLAVTVGKIAAPILVARVLLWRRLHEIFPLAFLLMAVVEYMKFPNGAKVHIYWPMPFAPYWALALGALCASAMGVARWALSLAGRDGEQRLVPVVALVVFGLVGLRVLPDGITGLRYSKRTGGRFDEKGRRIFTDIDTEQAMEWMGARMAPGVPAVMLRDVYTRENRGQEWALRRPLRGYSMDQFTLGSRENRYFVGDLRFVPGPEQRRAASTFHLVTLGPYLYIDRNDPNAPLDAYRFDEREPTFLEWYFASPTEPVRTVRRDPWATWELRAHFDQQPNPPPEEAPETLEDLRIAHNVAVATADGVRTQALKAKLLASLDTSVTATFDDGMQLLGKRLVPGVDPQLDLYFLAPGPASADFMYEVVSHVAKAPALSLVTADDKEKKYGDPFVVAPRLWHKGFVYRERVDIRQRPGLEYFAGYFETQPNIASPKLADGQRDPLPLMSME